MANTGRPPRARRRRSGADPGHPQRGMQPEHGRPLRRLRSPSTIQRTAERDPEFAERARAGRRQRRARPAQEHPQRGQEGAILAGGGLGAGTRRFPTTTPAAAPTSSPSNKSACSLAQIRRNHRPEKCPSPRSASKSSNASIPARRGSLGKEPSRAASAEVARSNRLGLTRRRAKDNAAD